jgi:transcriptional regulator with XRE-family HTH domain
MTFAEKLRELREAAGLSEAKLAELSGVSFGAVHNYGLGLRRPTFEAAAKLARALGVTCDAFAACDDIAGSRLDGEAQQGVGPTVPPRGGARKAGAPPAEAQGPKGKRKGK